MDARLIYVFGTAGRASAREQLDLILSDPEGTRARDVGVVDVDAMPQVKLWYDRFQVPDGQFAVVLLDADGSEAWRGGAVTSTSELWKIVDGLPSRREHDN
jgi:uncharacterized protein DUF4174